jgi:hypothetical protein
MTLPFLRPLLTQSDLSAIQRFRRDHREWYQRVERVLLEPKSTYFVLNTYRREKVWDGSWERWGKGLFGVRCRQDFDELLGLRLGDAPPRRLRRAGAEGPPLRPPLAGVAVLRAGLPAGAASGLPRLRHGGGSPAGRYSPWAVGRWGGAGFVDQRLI